MWFTSSSGRIKLQLTRIQAATGDHQGQCEEGIAYLRTIPKLRRQLDKIDAETLRDELRTMGAWEDEEMSDHDENLSRILWIACGDINDETQQ